MNDKETAKSVRPNQAPSSPPQSTSEVDELRAQLAETNRKLDALLAAQASPIASQAAPVQSIVMPSVEVTRQRHEQQRKADEEARERNRNRAERELKEGPAQFECSLREPHSAARPTGINPRMTRVVGARDENEAQAKYKRYFGIINSPEISVRSLAAAA